MSAADGDGKGRRRAGAVLIAAGIVLILAGVFHVLGSIDRPRSHRFADRVGYDEVKVAVQHAYPVGFAIAMGGLAIALLGGRLRR